MTSVLFEQTRVTSFNANDLLVLGEYIESEDIYKVRTIDMENFLADVQGTSVESILYAALLVKKNAGTLVAGKWYLITDATTANIPLLVQATSVSTIGTDAKSPDFPQDEINYDFLSDAIKYRRDTLFEIAVCQDLRNLTGLTIGSGCRGLYIGSDTTGSIGANTIGGYIGDNCTVNISASSVRFFIDNNSQVTGRLTDCQIGSSCTLLPKTGSSNNEYYLVVMEAGTQMYVLNLLNVFIGFGTILQDGQISGNLNQKRFVQRVEDIDLSSSTTLYNSGLFAEIKGNSNGDAALIYINDSNVEVIVNAAV